eukprot:NODE_5973_length_540_cov_127.090722.p1 GENE.NODE_5973_length_540_cov_127.090722~~NODE_5973_length_540_cov_127.090722.p1  ORF type:complete len:100 (+),score=22.19 NODE_5973_length_540_cov_127.090722:3-302(+)
MGGSSNFVSRLVLPEGEDGPPLPCTVPQAEMATEIPEYLQIKAPQPPAALDINAMLNPPKDNTPKPGAVEKVSDFCGRGGLKLLAVPVVLVSLKYIKIK